MSGTFEDLNVPPTLVAFAIVTADARCIISPEFKSTDSTLILLPLERDEYDLPNFDQLEKNYALVYELIQKGKILAAHSVEGGGIAEAVSKMCFWQWYRVYVSACRSRVLVPAFVWILTIGSSE